MKKIHALTAVAVMSVGVIGLTGLVLANDSFSLMDETKAKDVYTVTWTDSPEILDNGDLLLKGEQGGEIKVAASELADVQKGVVSLKPNGTFKNISSIGMPGIGSIKSVALEYTIGDSTTPYEGNGTSVLSLRYGYNVSKDNLNPAYGQYEAFQLSKTFTKGNPSYLEFKVTGNEIINITKITISYGCLTHEYLNIPEDNGVLKDNVFEFENAAVKGNSKLSGNNVNNHFCAEDTFMINPNFSGGICLENIVVGTVFSFDITSNKAVTVPFNVGFSANDNTLTLGDYMHISNNGNTSLVDTSKKLATTPDYVPDFEDWLANYFHMYKASGFISLVEGENHIELEIVRPSTNVDNFSIQTSATLTDNTVGRFDDKDFTITVTTPATASSYGNIEVKCNHQGCLHENVKNIQLAKLTNKNYVMRNIDKDTHHFMTLFGQEYDCGTSKLGRYPVDEGVKKDYYFEFENSKIDGPSKTGQIENDHFCISNSFVFSKDFSGNVCVENTVANKDTFTFVVNSDKEVRVPFTMGLGTIDGRRLSQVFDMKINGNAEQVYNDDATTTQTTTPDVGELSIWFNMITANGEFFLDKGENIITIFSKGYINLDYLKISTSATLIDNTPSTFAGENAPTIEITKVPTEAEKGTIALTCNDPKCGHKVRSFDLPVLGTSCYYEKNGQTFIKLYNQEVLVK